jgi:hypothetical protein
VGKIDIHINILSLMDSAIQKADTHCIVLIRLIEIEG